MGFKQVLFWLLVATFTLVILGLAATGYQLYQQGEITETESMVSIASSTATVFLVLLTIWQVHRTNEMFEEEHERNIDFYEQRTKAENIEREIRSLDEAELIVKSLRTKYLQSKTRGKRVVSDDTEFREMSDDDINELEDWLEVLRSQGLNTRNVLDAEYLINHIETTFETHQKLAPIESDEIRFAIDDLISNIASRRAELANSEERLGIV